jgi:hypothetical protein
MKKTSTRLKFLTLHGIVFAAAAVAISPQALALDNIIHEYMSVRTMGMGGVRMTTGQYEENFFSNPARTTANPRSKFELLGLTAEGSNFTNVVNTVKAITNKSDIVQTLGDQAGSNTHVRLETDIANYFLTSNDERKWALGFGLFTSTQIDMDLRQSFQIGAQGVLDAGMNLSFAYKFLHDKLSVGTTAHGIFRGASNPDFTFSQLLQGKSLSPNGNAGEGAMIDFDLGVTYDLPILRDSNFTFAVGAAIDNVLGGNFNMMNNLVSSLTCTNANGTTTSCQPLSSPRSLGFGISARRDFWGPFVNTMMAVEITDIGADGNSNLGGTTTPRGAGGIFRTVHIGGETHWKIFALRAGINQGYMGLGFGLDLRFFTLDAAYYGEEMSLNSGGLEDRRFALKLAFQI